MAESKKNRRQYRATLAHRGLVRADRFDDLMTAVTGGGTRPCGWCGLAMPAEREPDVCEACQASVRRVRKVRVPLPSTPAATEDIEPGVIYVDASFRQGMAGLAVVGALGDHQKRVEARSSTQAEVLALAWALEIAKATERWGLTFRTDCQAAFRQFPLSRHRLIGNRLGWTVEQVPRRQNRQADRLAAVARDAGC